MSLNGFPDECGLRTGPTVMDIATELPATIAVLGALAAVFPQGRGYRARVKWPPLIVKPRRRDWARHNSIA
jgi:crotonobetainyl-CoA:carnitine CoA-transferase CaiB-like acyl-CoA transferase